MIALTDKRSTSWHLAPKVRKSVLLLHIISGVGWMGVDMALLTLLFTARTTNDAALVVSAFNAIRIVVPVVVPPLSLTILATGLVLGLGTPWGLLRYWWVLVKLGLSSIMTVLVFTSLVPAVDKITNLAFTNVSANAVRADLGSLPTDLMYPPIVSFLMLGVAAMLAVFKPWQFTPWGSKARSNTKTVT